MLILPCAASGPRTFCCHDVLITRAGRNTLAEAAYCGIPAVVLPVALERHLNQEGAGPR